MVYGEAPASVIAGLDDADKHRPAAERAIGFRLKRRGTADFFEDVRVLLVLGLRQPFAER